MRATDLNARELLATERNANELFATDLNACELLATERNTRELFATALNICELFAIALNALAPATRPFVLLSSD